jgi:glycerol-3-phosphate dehydrogenase
MVASLAGSSVPLTMSKGSLVITNHRLTNMVINRLRPPSDGDIVVPNEAVCLAGTTSLLVQDPDSIGIEPAEVDTIIGEAGRMLPHFNHTRIIRAFSGVRPLLMSKKMDSREISRGFQIFNHGNGMYSIVGGKLTTFRLMAEKMVDTIMDYYGLKTPCETAERPLDGQEELSGYPLSRRLADMKNIVCECELVHRQDIERIIGQTGTKNISDIQHRTRLGMGPCQGGFCTFRALGIMNDMSVLSPDQSMQALRGFLQRRFRGIRYALWGDQLREEQLVEYIYLGILAMEKPK